MGVTYEFFRLRIRNAADTADALIISSVPGGTNPYILKEPTGDGQSFDPLTGSVTTGSYTCQVIDVLTASNTRVVTSNLADAQARQQLLNRKAYLQQSDNGSTWVMLVAGYLTAVRMVDAITFEFAVGQTRRIEVSRKVFVTTTANFPNVTSIIGGPVIGGFMSARDYGGWRFKVTQVTAATGSSAAYTQLRIVSGFDPRKFNGKESQKFGSVSSAIANYTNNIAHQAYETSKRWIGASPTAIQGYFPGLTVRVETTAGALVGYFTPTAVPTPSGVGGIFGLFFAAVSASLIWSGQSLLYIDPTSGVDDAGAPVSLGAVGTEYNVYVYLNAVSKDNPLHISMHPVDIYKKLWDDAGIAYDASVLPAVKAAIGSQLVLYLRITQSYKLGEFIESVLNGPFGLATRIDDQGRRVLFTTRIKSSTLPVSTITLAELRDYGGTAFEIDESEIINKLTFKTERYIPWDDTRDDQPEPDGLVALPQVFPFIYDDNPTLAEREITYDLPGTFWPGGIGPLINPQKSYAEGVAIEVFDRFGRGPIKGEFNCLAAITAKVGDQIILSLPHIPVATAGATPVSQRGGQRVVQVLSRTETVTGPEMRMLDSGTIAQASLVPTFTLALDATTPTRYATVTITNAAALAAAGLKVRIEVATGAGTPASGSGSLFAVFDPAVATSATIGLDAGSTLWVQMRAELPGGQPSTYATFQSLALTSVNPPTSFAAGNVTENGVTQRYLTWALGANATAIPLELKARLAAETSASDVVIASLPAGTVRFRITGLIPASYTFTLRHRETPPAEGVSSAVTLTDTVTALAGLTAPSSPIAFSDGFGLFGVSVIATVIPSQVEIEVKEGAGAFVSQGTVESVEGNRTVWEGYAPNDGVLRTIRARHTSPGSAASGYTAEVTATPWVYQTGGDLPAPHTHPTSDIVSGVFVTDRLGTGAVPADAKKYLREDSTWHTPGGYVPVASAGAIVFDGTGDVVLTLFSP